MNPQFRAMLERNNFVVLDTETTGLERPAEIIEVAIVDPRANVLLNTLVRPHGLIPPSARDVHGITEGMCEDYPSWPFVRAQVLSAIRGKDVIVYNAVYDRKLMHWSDERYTTEHTDYKAEAAWHCAMEAYAEFHGDLHPYYGTYIWQRLSAACQQMGVSVTGGHRALDDALSCLRLIAACTPDLAVWSYTR